MKPKRVQPNQSIEKGLDIIEVMAEAGSPLRLSDIAAQTGLPAATALRMLHTFVLRRYAYQEPDTLRYGLTLGFARIGAMIHDKLRLRDIAHPSLVALSRECQESVCLAIEEDMEISYIDVLDGPDGMLKITQRIGKRAPMHCTGTGKVLLSAMPEKALDAFIEQKGLPRMTAHTLATREALLSELSHIAVTGYALDDEECELGARCVATGIHDFKRQCVAGISITGPSARMTKERIEAFVPMLLKTAEDIGKRLGQK